jgi:thiol-disulfide isomerase/thioredoxin
MKILISLLIAAVVTTSASAQEQSVLPAVQLRDAITGQILNTVELSSDSTPVVISFWATWCKPCLQELNVYHTLYNDWRSKYGVRIVAVSIDDSRNAQKVPAFVKGRKWTFDVLLDVNQDFKRAMNVNNVPHTFLVRNGRIVWQHAAYASGDEEDLENELKVLTGKSE